MRHYTSLALRYFVRSLTHSRYFASAKTSRRSHFRKTAFPDARWLTLSHYLYILFLVAQERAFARITVRECLAQNICPYGTFTLSRRTVCKAVFVSFRVWHTPSIYTRFFFSRVTRFSYRSIEFVRARTELLNIIYFFISKNLLRFFFRRSESFNRTVPTGAV